MFSTTITASSTTSPTASDSPSRVNVLSVQCRKYSTAMVPPSDIGIANTTLSVDDSEPRNSQQTAAVSTTASPSSSSISSTDSVMKLVVSNSTSTCMPG